MTIEATDVHLFGHPLTEVVDRTWKTGRVGPIGGRGYGPGDRLEAAVRQFAEDCPKGLRVEVFRWSIADASNRGVSKRCNTLLVVPPTFTVEDIDTLDEPTQTAIRGPGQVERGSFPPQRLGLVRLEYHSGGLVLRPLRPEDGADRHTMMGGNFGHTSDSRWPCRYPLPIHDRVER